MSKNVVRDMPAVTLACGDVVPAIGEGTWYLGDDPLHRDAELEALRCGVKAGMTLIDTAEMYGEGNAERLVGEALGGMAGTSRDDLFIVSKVLPWNAGRARMEASCRASLARMGIDHVDLYLHHWREGDDIPLEETVSCLEELREEGLIREWGVSNYDVADMEELFSIPGGERCQVNQVLYHAGSRGIEFDLLPWMREHGVTLMSYCPLAQAGRLRRGLLENPCLQRVARKHGATVEQVLLAWNIRDGHTIAIPRTRNFAHMQQNAAAARIRLDKEDLAAIDAAYPAPDRKVPLDME